MNEITHFFLSSYVVFARKSAATLIKLFDSLGGNAYSWAALIIKII